MVMLQERGMIERKSRDIRLKFCNREEYRGSGGKSKTTPREVRTWGAGREVECCRVVENDTAVRAWFAGLVGGLEGGEAPGKSLKVGTHFSQPIPYSSLPTPHS